MIYDAEYEIDQCEKRNVGRVCDFLRERGDDDLTARFSDLAETDNAAAEGLLREIAPDLARQNRLDYAATVMTSMVADGLVVRVTTADGVGAIMAHEGVAVRLAEGSLVPDGEDEFGRPQYLSTASS